jgi:hypothetical protein
MFAFPHESGVIDLTVVWRQCRLTANGGNDQESTWACRQFYFYGQPTEKREHGRASLPKSTHANRRAESF